MAPETSGCNGDILMTSTLTILGIAGSLRRDSYNRGVLRAAEQLAPAGMHLESFDLDGIPLYNQDLEKDIPQRVVDLKSRIRAADAILFVTPEYNYSVSGVLKNAIDWVSRPYGDNTWAGKPAALCGASGGMGGTARAQYHLRQMMVFLDMYPVNKPEVMIRNAAELFDAQGNLTDEKTRHMIGKLLQALADWTRRLAPR
jgi:chromate reductase, NAD(P)H dehydrogenase (quinone)